MVLLSSGELAKETAREGVPAGLRVGHLLRISYYLDVAILSMWADRQPGVALGMAEASARGAGPGGPEGSDEELLAQVRDLVVEAREYFRADDFPAAMARMRVAEDLVALRIVDLTGE